MKLSQQQRDVMKQLSDAYDSLSEIWTDEMGEKLNDLGLLPMRCLEEAEAECRHIAQTGEII